MFSDKKEKKKCFLFDVFNGDFSANLTYFSLSRSDVKKIELIHGGVLHIYPNEEDVVYDKVVSKLTQEFGEPKNFVSAQSWENSDCFVVLDKYTNSRGEKVLYIQPQNRRR